MAAAAGRRFPSVVCAQQPQGPYIHSPCPPKLVTSLMMESRPCADESAALAARRSVMWKVFMACGCLSERWGTRLCCAPHPLCFKGGRSMWRRGSACVLSTPPSGQFLIPAPCALRTGRCALIAKTLAELRSRGGRGTSPLAVADTEGRFRAGRRRTEGGPSRCGGTWSEAPT